VATMASNLANCSSTALLSISNHFVGLALLARYRRLETTPPSGHQVVVQANREIQNVLSDLGLRLDQSFLHLGHFLIHRICRRQQSNSRAGRSFSRLLMAFICSRKSRIWLITVIGFSNLVSDFNQQRELFFQFALRDGQARIGSDLQRCCVARTEHRELYLIVAWQRPRPAGAATPQRRMWAPCWRLRNRDPHTKRFSPRRREGCRHCDQARQKPSSCSPSSSFLGKWRITLPEASRMSSVILGCFAIGLSLNRCPFFRILSCRPPSFKEVFSQ